MESYCIYLRKSRRDAEAEMRGEGETLARHQNILVELAKKQKLNIVKIYKEIVSGDSISARPQMQNLLSDIAEKKYAGVLVVEIERLARGDTIDQGIVAQAFRESGTKIITPLKTYDPENEFDEEYFEFSLFMSRREYKTIKRRMQAGRLSAIKEGNYIGTNAPYGYRKVSPDSKTHTLEIVPHEAEIIRLIFDMYLSGHGSKYIANELNRMGISPQKSEYWEPPSIKKILSNPIYCGKIGWKTKANGETLYQGLHEPIISESTFLNAQKQKKTKAVAQTHANDTLLNYYHGVLYCKNCGHQLRRRVIAASLHEHILCTYRECRGKTVSASFEEVNDVLMTSIRHRIEALSAADESISEKSEPHTDKRKPLEAELEKVRRQQARLYDLLEQEIYDENTFLERSKIVTEKIKSLENALAEIKEQETSASLPASEAIIRLEYILANFAGANPLERNIMLKDAIRKIYYSKSQRMCRQKKDSDIALEIEFL